MTIAFRCYRPLAEPTDAPYARAMEAGESVGAERTPQRRGQRERPTDAAAATTLVLGGPGTGKTARLLAATDEARGSGGEALIVAVSPSAATVLRDRGGAGGVRVVTVPALALMVLRETAPA